MGCADAIDIARRRLLQGLAGAAAGPLISSGAAVRPVYAQAAPGALAAAELRGGLALITGAGGNVVLAPTSAGAVLIDSGAPEHAQALTRLVADRLQGGAVRALFNTHWHLEHTGGNEAVAPAEAAIVAHENTRLWMSTKFYVEWQDRYYQPRPPEALPDKTFLSHEAQPLKMRVGALEVEYGHLPEAHTDGDIYVRFPAHNVIVAGGTVAAGRYPILDYITGGWIGGMVDATRKLIGMTDADTLIVPDVGPPQRRADLEAQVMMLETVRERIEAIALEGRGVEDMIEAQITKEFDERYGSDSELFISNAYEGLWWSRLRGIVA
jgi:glyoxylase-like metal-dependent hydrolase (beta-lactamase superfamily II)